MARIAMGWPLTAAAALATYFPIKAAERAMPRRSADTADEPVESSDDPVGGGGVDVDPKPSGP
jgi:hypothetical protein